jgi:N2-citryl-N6-acetyl-N6-hydroxylysine synthase
MTDAFDPAASAFLNAFLREWSGFRSHASEDEPGLHVIEIPLRQGGGTLEIRARHLSRAGRHHLVAPVHLRDSKGARRALPFEDLVALILAEEDLVGPIAPDQASRFAARVLASSRNIAQHVEARAGDMEKLFSAPMDFIEAEQALLTGHSIHPTPKARDGLSDADARRYAPEFGQRFALRWFAVRRERWLARGVTLTPADTIARQLFAEDAGMSRLRAVPEGHALLPAHPWQAARFRELPSVERAFASGDLVDLGEGSASFTATSSLRTVYSPCAPWMLKFSTSVRLTNSLRTLRIPELDRGLLLCRVLDTPRGRDFARRFPRFRILAEPLYLGLCDSEQQAIEETLVTFRENPFRGKDRCEAYVLAALLQDHPHSGESWLARHVRALAKSEGRSPDVTAGLFFRRFLDAVLEPLLVAQADYGLLLSAHQQNLVLRLREGYPDLVWFRDCQGTAYSALALSLFGRDVEGLAEHTFEGERGNYFFSYSVVINAVFNVVASLAGDGLAAEDDLLFLLRSFLLELRRRSLGDPGCLDYLLQSEKLWSKGNFFCALRGINETTADDPLRIYHQVDNPLTAPSLR